MTMTDREAKREFARWAKARCQRRGYRPDVYLRRILRWVGLFR